MSKYEIDENDPALQAVKTEEATEIAKSDKLHDNQIAANNREKEGILDQIDANTQKLTDAQNAQTDLTIQEINQEKEYAKQDYTKEQSGAYADWQKQSNAYGVKSEQQAASGMTNTGYSESSQVSMYNAYQNRVAVARESYNRTVVSYNQAIAQARAQNSVALAELANQALAKSLEVTMQYATMNNSLFSQKMSNRNQIKDTYASKWATVLDKLYKEMALEEQARQHNETLAEQKRQHDAQMAAQAAALAEERRQFDILHPTTGATISKSGSGLVNKGKKTSSSPSYATIDGKKPDSGNVSKQSNTSKKSEATPDMKSVLALGYGPISAARLNELVESGKVVEVEKDGKLYYTKRFVG